MLEFHLFFIEIHNQLTKLLQIIHPYLTCIFINMHMLLTDILLHFLLVPPPKFLNTFWEFKKNSWTLLRVTFKSALIGRDSFLFFF